MHNILARKHWIFDMDGTLTVGVHDFDKVRQSLGLSVDAPILETLQQMPAEQAAPLWAKVNEWEFHFAAMAKPMPGAVELLASLTKQGCQLGIITRNYMPVAWQTLAACGLDHFFAREFILDRDACPPKPHPAGLHYLMDAWQADAADTVMVGDYQFDLAAGKAANAATIHIDTKGQFLWPDLTDWPVASLYDLMSNT